MTMYRLEHRIRRWAPRTPRNLTSPPSNSAPKHGGAGYRLLRPSMLRLGVALALLGARLASASSPYSRWQHGPPADPHFFPIAVWLQNPSRAAVYQRAGINTYVGLWKGPTEEQLTVLRHAGMRVICDQNEVGLRHRDDPTIIGWMHGDEPDNAQRKPDGSGYGPPIPPAKIVEDYHRMRRADATRPVMLNLGQGVAWDGWHGRGVRTNHPEDYPEYVKGGDIVSFDIYPACHRNSAVAGKLWYVARGVERLCRWAGPERVVWNCIECTRINHPTRKATPTEVRAEVWMSLVHGSRGIIYFVHEWQPHFNEAALLDDRPMLTAITELNRQIHTLAPVLNSPAVDGLVEETSADADAPVAYTVRRYKGALYIFAVAMRPQTTRATFMLTSASSDHGSVEVLGEQRTLPVHGDRFEDTFGPWAVYLYRLRWK